MASFDTIHDAADHTGLPGVSGGGLEWTATTLETVLNSTTAIAVARTLTPAITVVPGTAVLATGFLQINVNAAVNNANWIAVFHQDTNGYEAATARSGFGSGITLDMPFTCKVTHSSGAKLYYQIARNAGTITYLLHVTGYWAPA